MDIKGTIEAGFVAGDNGWLWCPLCDQYQLVQNIRKGGVFQVLGPKHKCQNSIIHPLYGLHNLKHCAQSFEGLLVVQRMAGNSQSGYTIVPP